jgi:transcriptional regulator with XRE-family HTH domain
MTSLDYAGTVRRIRRNAIMSQRELARACGVPRSTISKIESRRLIPTLQNLQSILAVGNCHLVVLDESGTPLSPYNGGELRDRAHRLYPAHLDVREVGPNGEGWWGQLTVQDYVRKQPTHTFYRRRWLYELDRPSRKNESG